MKRWNSLADWLQSRDLFTKMMIVAAADFVVLMAAVLIAYALRISALEMPPGDRAHLYLMAPILSIVSAILFGVYRSSSRSYSMSLEKRLVISQLVVPLLWSFALLFFGISGFARSTVLIYGMLSILAMIALRRGAAWALTKPLAHSLPLKEQVPVIIYGAGREGQALAEALRQQGRFRPAAFVDTDYTLVERVVAGLKVYSSEQLDEVVVKTRAQEAVIAKPRQNRASRRALVDMLLERGLRVKIMPALDEIIDGRIDVSALRPIHLEDLLGRDPVPPDRALMEKAVTGRVIMVTGAGGSIGSELVRQACPFGPAKIVMIDTNEFALFEINRDMEARIAGRNEAPALVPLLADILDRQRMAAIMAEHRVEVVFHAAAYKHVRMVQENALAGITNNVFGTLAVAQAAIASKVKLFVMISTDKAVRPTSIMGASKRVAEMVIQALAARQGEKPIFAMVRFGNVLGSTGSVVPLFQEQIARGGPVLVTDPEVTRYFMLIPEAAQLVIQAGAMAEGGEVFVLDMGESVKIVQLAETMIELAGLTRRTADNPVGDVEIKFIGLRDGEKLYEELQIGRDVSITPHQRILKSREFYLPWLQLEKEIAAIRASMEPNGGVIDVDRIFRLALDADGDRPRHAGTTGTGAARRIRQEVTRAT